MKLHTERLHIVKATLNDTSFFIELLNSPGWLQYIGDRKVKNKTDAEKYIQSAIVNKYKTCGFGLYKLLLQPENIPIGICGFIKRDFLDHPDLGFALLPRYEGKGYIYEAAATLLEYGKTHLHFTRILSITSPENQRCHRVLNKLGMKKSGTVEPHPDAPALLLYSIS